MVMLTNPLQTYDLFMMTTPWFDETFFWLAKFFNDGGMKIFVPFIHLYKVSRFWMIMEIFFSNSCKICKISFCLITFFWSSKQWNLSNVIHNAVIFKEKENNQKLIFEPLHSACFSNIFAHLPTYLDTTTAVHKYCTQVFTTLANTLVIWTSWCTFSLGTRVKIISRRYIHSTITQKPWILVIPAIIAFGFR